MQDQQSPPRVCKSVMRGFARRQEILSIYNGGKTPLIRREPQPGSRSVKGRNKMVHCKSISDNVMNSRDKSLTPAIEDYDFNSYAPHQLQQMKNKRYEVYSSLLKFNMKVHLLSLCTRL